MVCLKIPGFAATNTTGNFPDVVSKVFTSMSTNMAGNPPSVSSKIHTSVITNMALPRLYRALFKISSFGATNTTTKCSSGR